MATSLIIHGGIAGRRVASAAASHRRASTMGCRCNRGGSRTLAVGGDSMMPELNPRSRLVTKRGMLAGMAGLAGLSLAGGRSFALDAAVVRPELAPQGVFDISDPDLRAAAALLEKGLGAGDVRAEQAIWTEIITKYEKLDREWVPDIVARAYGNRGNSRSRQGDLEGALGDFDRAIKLAPYAVDPVLNRGVALENLGRYAEADADYRAVLTAEPNDPAAWNNLGNVALALGKYDEAVEDYGKAVSLAPQFAFAAANQAIALFAAGRKAEGLRQMRTLLRRYPDFDDMRAALAAGLWAEGLEGNAETEWARVDDPRYRDRAWIKDTRRWPPALVSGLEALLDVKSV